MYPKPRQRVIATALTLEDLYNSFQRLYGVEREEAREVMKKNGCQVYKVESWLLYHDYLKNHLRQKEAERYWHGKCPICEGKITRKTDRDWKFGENWGWDCTADTSHFFKYLAVKLQKSQEQGKKRKKEGKELDLEALVQRDREYRMKNMKPFVP